MRQSFAIQVDHPWLGNFRRAGRSLVCKLVTQVPGQALTILTQIHRPHIAFWRKHQRKQCLLCLTSWSILRGLCQDGSTSGTIMRFSHPGWRLAWLGQPSIMLKWTIQMHMSLASVSHLPIHYSSDCLFALQSSIPLYTSHGTRRNGARIIIGKLRKSSWNTQVHLFLSTVSK